MRAALAKGMTEVGYRVAAAGSAEEAIRRLQNARPDLTILDLGLPGQDGYAVLREVRKRYGDMPILILTARDSVKDRVAGLDAGADDYLVKPFAFAELLARVRARLRPRDTRAALRVGNLTVDPIAGVARSGDTVLELTPLEFNLLRVLTLNAGAIVTHEMLATAVWHVHSRATPIDNLIHVHVSHLREKLGELTPSAAIRTVRGLGYMLEAAP